MTDGGTAPLPRADAGTGAGPRADAGTKLASRVDAGAAVAPRADGGTVAPRTDAGAVVAPRTDAGASSSPPDAGPKTLPDAGTALAPSADAGPTASLLLEGDLHLAAERFADAARVYAAALALDPQSAEAHFKCGVALAAAGDAAAAIPHWEQARTLSRDAAVQRHAEDNIARARARLAARADAGAGDLASARAAYEAGVQRVLARDYAAALPLFGRALALQPDLALAHVARGGALVGLRRFDEALADYEAALRLAPQLAAPHYGMGEAHRGLGRSAAARAAYERYAASTAPDARPELQADARRKAAALR